MFLNVGGFGFFFLFFSLAALGYAPLITWKEFQSCMPWEIAIFVGGGLNMQDVQKAELKIKKSILCLQTLHTVMTAIYYLLKLKPDGGRRCSEFSEVIPMWSTAAYSSKSSRFLPRLWS